MGQHIQFIFTRTEEGVRAWDLAIDFNPALIDISKYKVLLFHAAYEVLQPLGITETTLRDWLFSRPSYMVLLDACTSNLELPLFFNLE